MTPGLENGSPTKESEKEGGKVKEYQATTFPPNHWSKLMTWSTTRVEIQETGGTTQVLRMSTTK
jgi:hypothetical protein